MKDKKILGVDFGKSKIGLALAEHGLVSTLVVLRKRQNFVKDVCRIAKEEKADMIVVGVSDAQAGKEARDFGRIVERISNLRVDYQDETLTTKDALDKMIEAGKGRKYRREKEDLFAAALILEIYCQENV
ncbi:MAG: Holliday junction resolvase RuvX [Patescibacteria group bacterium]|nr:Holliday junction resolvase RuvX [Patescibacteria group bacterium]